MAINRSDLPTNATLPMSFHTATGRSEIHALTGLRGCAAAMVMLYHFNGQQSLAGRAGTSIGNGYLCVDAFFVLSGFVMAYTYCDAALHGGWQFYRMFLVRRFARIYPLYAAVTLETAGVALWRSHGYHMSHFVVTLLANLTMTQAWGLASSFEGATWSLSTEWAAYLIFPILLTATMFASPRVALLSGFAAIMVIAALATSPGPFAYPFQNRHGPLDIYSAATPAPLLRCIADFTLGLLSYRMACKWACASFKGSELVSVTAATAVVILMTLPGYDVAVVLVFPVLITSLASQRGIVARLLSSTFLIWLGDRSYSVYLLHDKFSRISATLSDIVSTTLRQDMVISAVIAQTATGAIVFLFASLSYQYVEKPCRNLLRTLLE